MKKLEITNVEFAAASPEEVELGLLGWVSFDLGNFRVDGCTLRRSATGMHLLSFPARKDVNGKQHFYFCPRNNISRAQIEHQVFRALNLERRAPR